MESALQSLDLATLHARRDAAMAAFDELVTGKQEASVRTDDGVSVTYTAANIGALQLYINRLELAIRLKGGGLGRGAINPVAVC